MSDLDASLVVLSAASLSANIGERLLIDDQEFILREGERVGLVGRNGAGKSSLLRILAGRDHFYSGEISCRKLLRCAYLPQAIELDETYTLAYFNAGRASQMMGFTNDAAHYYQMALDMNSITNELDEDDIRERLHKLFEV